MTAASREYLRSLPARVGFFLALASAVAALAAGFGNRWEWWDYRVALSALSWCAYGALAAAGVSLVGAILARPGAGRRGFGWALLGLAVGLATFAVPALELRLARSLPRIHDVTTDTANPPRFIAVLPLRAHAPNSAEYGGPELAAQQRAAYPDIAPVTVTLPSERVFGVALDAAKAMGWQVVAAVPAEGRIEAVATTFWFGFKDDVVVRITPAAGGARVDVRSVSRVGVSDVGANAKRVRAYLARLKTALGA